MQARRWEYVVRHALWLIPVSTAAFAATYQRWFWHKPRGIPDSGMDAIGYYPTDVVWAMLPVTFIVALVMAAYSTRSTWWGVRR